MSPTGRRLTIAALTAVLLLPSAWIAWSARDLSQLGHLGDDGVYWVSAKALATGQGYRIISLPERPFQTKYPPLYPALLSLVWRAVPRMPDNFGLAIFVSWLMLPLLVAAAAPWYRQMGFGPVRTGIFCALIATNLVVVHFMVYLMPELLFCALLLVSITIADRATESGSARMAAIGGLIAAAAYLTKSAALPLVACSPLLFLWRKRPRCAAAFAATMLPFVAAWMLWCRAHRASGLDDVTLFYTDYLGYQIYNVPPRDLAHVLWTNLRILPSAMGTLLAYPASSGILGRVVPRLAALAATVGVVRIARQDRLSHYHTFAVGYVPQLLIWHFPPAPRFLLPLFALLLAGLCIEVERAARWVRKSLYATTARRLAAVAATLFLLDAAGAAILTRYAPALWLIPLELQEARAETAGLRDTYYWIARTFPPETPFVTDLSEAFYLYTGRPAVSMAIPPKFLYEGAAGQNGIDERYHSLAAFARSRGIPYVLSTRWDYALDSLPERTRAMMAGYFADRSTFQPVHETPGATVYRIAPLP